MNISIYQTNNSYSFKLGNFDSALKYFIFPHVKSSYKFAWQAERDARKILKGMRSVLAVETDAEEAKVYNKDEHPSFEDMIVSHYLGAYNSLVDKASGVKDGEREDREKVYAEIVLTVDNLLKIKEGIENEDGKIKIDKIIGQFSRLTKENFNDLLQEDREQKEANSLKRYLHSENKVPFTKEEELEILENFAQTACKSMQDKINDVVYLLSPEEKKIELVSNGKKLKYITLFLDEDFLLNKILPHSYMAKSNSVEFYQEIFKPIFEGVGHFKISTKKLLLIFGKSRLPDSPESDGIFDVEALDTETKKPCFINISFKNNKWATSNKLIKNAENVSRYTEMDYLKDGGALVECTDQGLESIYGKVGRVKQVLPIDSTSLLYLDVDFGNAIIRLTEEQIKIKS